MEKRVDLLNLGQEFLAREGVVNSLRESEIFLSHILDCPRIELYLDNLTVEKNNTRDYWHLLDTRAKGLPLQYILGSTEFMGLEFKVHPGVFIPRPETEILVETVLNYPLSTPLHPLKVLDIGTGCGNIAVSLGKYLNVADIFACDISDSALKLAKGNSSLNKVGISLVQSDLFSAFKRDKNSFSLVISNPPYISAQIIGELSREVHFEPRGALDGGSDGLSYYRRIINEAPAYLQNNGLLALEIGDDQMVFVQKIFEQSKRFSKITIVKDYNNVERVIIAQKID